MARIIARSTARPGSARPWVTAVAAAGALAVGAGWVLGGPQPSARGDGAAQARALAPAPQPSRAAAPAPWPPGGDAPPGTSASPAVVLERIELAPSGVAVAVLRVNGGPPMRHGLGDSLGPGIRLARIAADSVAVEREGKLQVLDLPRGVEPLRRDVARVATAAVRLTSTWPRPPTPAVAALLDADPSPGVVTPSPDRANPARSGIDRTVAAEALRLATP